MAFWQYRPFSIRFPEDSPLRRMMVASQPMGDGPPWPTAEESLQFDDRTLFWDLRWDPDTGLFEALGPPLDNLSDMLADISLTVTQGDTMMTEGLPLRVTRASPNVMHYIADQRVDLDPEALSHVSAWSRETALGETRLRGHRRRIAGYTAVTVQRNTRPEHLRDWLDYLYWHGVNGAVIYDNGSTNHAELRDMLHDRGSQQAVMFVDWPMPGGPARFPELCTGDDGPIAHAALWYQRCDWIIGLDVHDFPVLGGNRLADFLKQQRSRVGAVQFAGRDLHATEDAPPPTGIRDLSLADRRATLAGKRALRPAAALSADASAVVLAPGHSLRNISMREASYCRALALTTPAAAAAEPPDTPPPRQVAPEPALAASFAVIDARKRRKERQKG